MVEIWLTPSLKAVIMLFLMMDDIAIAHIFADVSTFLALFSHLYEI